MASESPNKLKELLWLKVIDGDNDDFKCCLMADGYTFDRDNDSVYADISAEEHANGNGYTTGGVLLTGQTVTKDDANDAGILSFDNPSWTMSGGDLAAVGAIIYDDTVSSPVAKPIVAWIDFGALLTTYDGGVFSIADIAVSIVTG